MSQQSRHFLTLLTALLVQQTALGAEVKGTLVLPTVVVGNVPTGYTATRVAAPAASFRAPHVDGAVFLRSKESLPLPPPTAKWKLKISGLRFEPSVIACAVDETIEILNADRTDMTVGVGAETLQAIKPGATLSYLCQQDGVLRLRVLEWPHMRATLYVGAVGITGIPGPDGKFSLNAPAGTYALEIIGPDAKLGELSVTVAQNAVDLGRIEGATPAPAAAPGGSPAASPSPSPSPAASPTAEPKPSKEPKPSPRPEGSAAPRPKPKPAGDEDPFKLEP